MDLCSMFETSYAGLDLRVELGKQSLFLHQQPCFRQDAAYHFGISAVFMRLA